MRLNLKSLFRRPRSLRKKDAHVQKPPYVVKPFHDPSAATSHVDHASLRHDSRSQSAQSSLEPNDELVTAPTSPRHIVSKTGDSAAASYMPDLPTFPPLTLPEDEQYMNEGYEKKLETDAGKMKHSEVGVMSQVESRHVPDTRPKRKPIAGSVAEERPRKRASIDSGNVGEHLLNGENNELDHKHGFKNRQQNNNEYHGVELAGIVDLKDSEDTDHTTTWAPAVTHEIIKPTEHEIIEERIYREIHNHDYYHYVLPVHETEILPARHFVTNPDGSLVEVSSDTFPGWTAQNQRWQITRKELSSNKNTSFIPRQTEPRIISDRTYVTPEGYPRRETTILHPPELEDLSDYSGPVMPVEFTHFESDDEEISVEPVEVRSGKGEVHHQLNDSGSFSLTDMMNALSITSNGELRL